MFPDVATDRGDQGRHAAECPAPQTLARNLGKEAFDEIEPRRSGGREVEMKARVRGQPGRHGGVLVSAIVIENEMDVLPARRLAIDHVQERDELAVGVARLTALN